MCSQWWLKWLVWMWWCLTNHTWGSPAACLLLDAPYIDNETCAKRDRWKKVNSRFTVLKSLDYPRVTWTNTFWCSQLVVSSLICGIKSEMADAVRVMECGSATLAHWGHSAHEKKSRLCQVRLWIESWRAHYSNREFKCCVSQLVEAHVAEIWAGETTDLNTEWKLRGEKRKGLKQDEKCQLSHRGKAV